MAVNAYLLIKPYNADYLVGESQNATKFTPLGGYPTPNTAASYIDVPSYSFDVQQTLNIGSQSSGAGAGKIAFDAFTFSKSIDTLSPKLFQACASGTPYADMILALVKSPTAGSAPAGQIYLQYVFKLAAIKSLSWSYDAESPKESVSVEYGGLQIYYAPQSPTGQLGQTVMAGWNRVSNVSDPGNGTIK